MNIKDKLQRIDKDYFNLLVKIGEIAESLQLKPFLVGGMVRDLLLGKENLDIDITVENDGIKLAKEMEKFCPNARVKVIHDSFKTAKVRFNFGAKSLDVDFATTREEIYEYPAALPAVKISTLEKDLIRRDFTINALAVSLLPRNFGEVVDFYGGLKDLTHRKICLLPNDKSFCDDPTRIIRAVRFALRLGFEIEGNTNNKIISIIESGRFDNLISTIRGDRVKIEIRYLFNLSNVESVINEFFDKGIYRLISTELKKINIKNIYTDLENQWLVVFGTILSSIDLDKRSSIYKNLQMTKNESDVIEEGIIVSKKLSPNLSPFQFYTLLKPLKTESIYILKSLSNSITQAGIDNYLNKTSKIKLEITGDDIKNLGVSEGKRIGEILDNILEIKIQNPDMKRDEELKEALRLYLR